MKTIFRIFVVCFVLLLIALVGGYFALTNAGIQKRLVEKQLPEGSSIESIHVTAGKLQLSGLIVLLPDGTRVELGGIDTAFDPLAAVFDQTIKLGVLQIAGLRVDLPQAAEVQAPSGSSSGATGTSGGTRPVDSSGGGAPSVPSGSKSAEASDPLEALYALENFEWLFDIEQIALDAEIHDGAGAQYVLSVESGAIRPGQPSKVEASLRLVSDAPLASGLKSFDSQATLSFTQKIGGGFESLNLKSKTSGDDAAGGQLLAVNQSLDLTVDQTEGLATVSVVFDADLPKPELLSPELSVLGPVKVAGKAQASSDGVVLTLQSADLNVSAQGAQILALNLKQTMVLGGGQNPSGDLLDVKLTQLPLEWLNPWLSNGMQVRSDAPLSLALTVSGAPSGALAIRFEQPIQLGPLTVLDGGQALLDGVTLEAHPEVDLSINQTVTYALNGLQFSDRYGTVLTGSSKGVIYPEDRGAEQPLAGITSQTQLQIGLQPLFSLPPLADSASIIGGSLALDLNVDGAAKYPLQLQGQIKGLRASTQPGVIKDYDVALQVMQTQHAGEWGVIADFQTGSALRRSTQLAFVATANPTRDPLTFDARLTSPKVTQVDFDTLIAAFTPRETAVAVPSTPIPQAPRRADERTRVSKPSTPPVATGPTPPPWSTVDGSVSVKIDELVLASGHSIQAITANLRVTEPRLSLSQLYAKIGEGEVKGSSEVLFVPASARSYTLSADLAFSEINPAFFAKKHTLKAPPLRGKFDGSFRVRGAGQSLDAAVEDSEASLKVTGQDGVFTAFELDSRQQLGQVGLGLAGLLGDHLDRPGISALSNTIPYFKDIRFDEFVFELNRGLDKQIVIPEMRITNESMQIDGSGSVASSVLSEAMQQPLSLKIRLGAKGKLSGYLETLNLLQPTVAEDGFRYWNQNVEITGSLDDPDAEGLMDVLNDAAKGIYSKSKKQKDVPAAQADSTQSTSAELAPQAETPKKKSKEERLSDDIDTGLDMLNSIFGN